MILDIKEPVGAGGFNKRDDTARVSAAMDAIDVQEASDFSRMGFWDDALDTTIKSFQRDKGLDVDGLINPGGPTQDRINGLLSDWSLDDPVGRTATHEAWIKDALSPVADEALNPPPPLSEKEIAERRNPGDLFFKVADMPIPSPFAGIEPPHESASHFPRDGSRRSLAGPVVRGLDGEPHSPKTDNDFLTGLGFRYRPDPFGRLDQGDWESPDGAPVQRRVVNELLKAKPARQGDWFGGSVRDAEAGHRSDVSQNSFQELRPVLEREAKRAPLFRKTVQMAVPLASAPSLATGDDEDIAGVANNVLQTSFVLSALAGVPMTAEAVPEILEAVYTTGGATRAKSMPNVGQLLRDFSAAPEDGEIPIIARGLLALHKEEKAAARSAGLRDAEGRADLSIVQFLTANGGGPSWRITHRENSGEGNISAGIILVADDKKNKTRSNKPRGMHNRRTRLAVTEGRIQHKRLEKKILEKRKKNSLWRSNQSIGETGAKVRPDVKTPRGRFLELKPNTPSGRRKGKAQKEKYHRISGKTVRVIYYKPRWPELLRMFQNMGRAKPTPFGGGFGIPIKGIRRFWRVRKMN